MDDTLRACRALWRDSPASFSSPTVSFDGVHCEPRPVRTGGIPIWVGGSSVARTARRVAEYADGWIPPPSLSVDQIAAGVSRIRESSAREPEVSFALPIVHDELERSLELVPALRAVGVTALQVTVGRFVASPREAPAFFDRLASAFEPFR
jgi:alkanesulfonate monooxygenase SsuD/methylene tetrahydromethanopterin reductase-like flavin-dependent oxidoreductase (luciferase family)